MEELTAARNHLRAALKRYTRACSAVQSCLMQGNITNGSVPQELSDRIDNELQHITSYETDIKQAKVAISLSRNSLPAIVAINTLPSEILGYIFQLAVDTQVCHLDRLDNSQKLLPTDLDRLIHVCTRWRQIAISSHALWSHIDVTPSCSLSQRLLSRAEVYATRAGQSFLDIHIIKGGDPNPGDFYHSVFRSCFGADPPGKFTQITIENDCYLGDSGFIGAAEDTDNVDLQLDLPRARFEDIWLSVKALQLTGLFPRWTSKAYHGLVDLRLISTDAPVITESQLVNILTASPGLHTFHFRLTFTHSPREDESIVPVQLKDLEVLVWTPESSISQQSGKFLRWIAPGSKPLQVSMQNYVGGDEGDAEPASFDDGTKKFFARSSITKFHLKGPGIHISLVTEILGLMPSLQILALGRSGRVQTHTPVPAPSGPKAYPTRLSTLYLLESSINLDELRQVARRHSVQTLTFWDCTVYRNRRSKVYINKNEAEPQLHAICPSFKFSDSNPIQDWDHIVEW